MLRNYKLPCGYFYTSKTKKAIPEVWLPSIWDFSPSLSKKGLPVSNSLISISLIPKWNNKQYVAHISRNQHIIQFSRHWKCCVWIVKQALNKLIDAFRCAYGTFQVNRVILGAYCRSVLSYHIFIFLQNDGSLVLQVPCSPIWIAQTTVHATSWRTFIVDAD